MNEQAIKRFGTEEPAPEQRVLTAGPLSATLEEGQLRWIRIGEAEAIRAIAFLIRDRNWSTANPEISDLDIQEGKNGFRITFTARCPTIDGTFTWRGEFTGTPDGTLRCVSVGAADQDFLTSRTGFVILHPLKGLVGKSVTVEHAGGKKKKSRVPEEIVPDQPFLLVRAMTHSPSSGVTAEIRMEGDTWETEDHRNWTDASLKTYSRPLSLPYPYEVPKGEEIRHTVTLKFTGKLPKEPAAAPGPVVVKLGGPAGKMPKVGLSVLPEDARAALRVAPLVKAAGVQHLNCRIDLRAKGWQKPLADYAALAKETGAEIVLEVIIPGVDKPAKELGEAAKAARGAKLKPQVVVVTPAADLKSYPPGTPFPEGVPTFEEVAAAARKAFRNARVGGGMLSNFTELNRKRPPKKAFDFITHASSAMIHAADDQSVMETLESLEHIIHSTKAIIGKTPYRIGPSHIGNSFNPYGASVTPNPDGVRVTMARVEPRHRGLFGAAWHLGYLSQVAAGGLEAVTMASPVGEFGIVYRKQKYPQPWYDTARGAKVYPVYHVIRGIAAAAGAKRIDAQSSDTDRVRTLAWKKGRTTHVWLANLRDETVEVKLRGLGKGKASLMMLDEESFEQAARDPDFTDKAAPFTGTTVTLAPFAMARLDVTGEACGGRRTAAGDQAIMMTTSQAPRLEAATRPTLYFIGVTTARSSILRVFPRWAETLGLADARIVGVDLPLHAPAEDYRSVVCFIKDDPLSRGALVTTHKIDLLEACRDLFDEIDDLAKLTGELSCLSKRDGRLIGTAKDPITGGLALDSFLPAGHFAQSKAEAFFIGAGGAAIAITWSLMRAERGADRPSRIVVSDRERSRLDAIAHHHRDFGFDTPVAYVLAAAAADNDRVMAGLPAGSLVVNATGLGKDAPGSPITDAAVFPRDGFAWELNYRGDLVFLDQARRAAERQPLTVTDGWVYFLHGWTRVIAEVFDIDIPTSGPDFERLSEIAASA